jgi:hypothetical protein
LGGTNYLIITHSLFHDQAEQIASLKEAEGHHVAVVDVERAYDRFSAGLVEANAVGALIRYVAAQGQLKNVLLIGDDTFDTHDYLGTGAIAFIPSLLGWDGEFGRVPSENRYADLNGDGSPDLAIGRLPVQTTEEAAVLSEKIARQRSVLWTNRPVHLFTVDNSAPGDISFAALAHTAAAQLPGGTSTAWADVSIVGIDAARSTLLRGLQDGPMMIHYFGHAGPESWSNQSLLTLEDLAGLAGTYRETILFTWTCEAQFYQYLFGPTINEALYLVPGGGALASFGPAGVTDPALQQALSSRVYQYFLTKRLPLGEAIRRAKAEAMAADPATGPVIEGFNLLGDPTLRLP